MKRNLIILIVLVLATLIAVCSDNHNESDSIITGSGTIRFINLEDGFFGIVGDDGNRYDPINLEEEFRVDGLRVEFKLKKRPEGVSIHMWGIPVEVLEIKKIE
jgi:hypothetical protein